MQIFIIIFEVKPLAFYFISSTIR